MVSMHLPLCCTKLSEQYDCALHKYDHSWESPGIVIMIDAESILVDYENATKVPRTDLLC